MSAPAIGGQRYAISDQRPGVLASQPKWLWYAGGAMIGVGFLLWLRSRGTQSGPALVSTPSTNTQSELGNVNDSLLGLQALIARSGGNINPPPSSVAAGYVPIAESQHPDYVPIPNAGFLGMTTTGVPQYTNPSTVPGVVPTLITPQQQWEQLHGMPWPEATMGPYGGYAPGQNPALYNGPPLTY